MARGILDQPNHTPADSDFPFGRIKDNPGDNSGTKMNENSCGDIFQFFMKMLSEAGIATNNLPDNDYSGYQLYEAFQKLAFDTGTKTTMSLDNGFSGQVGNLPSYRKDSMSTVYLSGRLVAPGGQDSFFTLPSGYRPNKEKSFVIPGAFPSFDAYALIISTSGLCRVFTFSGTDLSAAEPCYLDVAFNIND